MRKFARVTQFLFVSLCLFGVSGKSADPPNDLKKVFEEIRAILAREAAPEAQDLMTELERQAQVEGINLGPFERAFAYEIFFAYRLQEHERDFLVMPPGPSVLWVNTKGSKEELDITNLVVRTLTHSLEKVERIDFAKIGIPPVPRVLREVLTRSQNKAIVIFEHFPQYRGNAAGRWTFLPDLTRMHHQPTIFLILDQTNSFAHLTEDEHDILEPQVKGMLSCEGPFH